MSIQKKPLRTLLACIDRMKKTCILGALFMIIATHSLIGQDNPEIHHFIKPSPTGKTIPQDERDLPIVGQADIVVVGGGVSGVAAALGAANEGMSVILLESRNYLGREITGTLNCRAVDPQRSLSGEMFREMVEKGIISENSVNPVEFSSYLMEKINGAPKIKVYLFSLGNGVIYQQGKVQGVVFSGRSGKQVILAQAVVDATEDGRITAAAGGKFFRTLNGANVARRFIAIKRPEYLPIGARIVPSGLGIDGDSVMIHDQYIEFGLEVEIGEDAAGDLSAIHAGTFDKCFALRDHFQKEGIAFEKNFLPAPETWLDKTPEVYCRSRWSGDLSDFEAVLPASVEGLVATGRIVDKSLKNIQDLLDVGETSGMAAVGIARKTPEHIKINSTQIKNTFSERMHIEERLEGIEQGIKYNLIKEANTQVPVRGEYDVLVVGGGTSGAVSAIAAARQGARVAVIEILPNLGGIGSNRVDGYYYGAPWKSFLRQDLGKRINLRKSEGAGPLEKVPFSLEDKKYALQQMAIEAGVTIYYQSLATGAVVEGNKARGVVIENASGRHVLLADVIVDATGHAGIAIAAGAKYARGRETDGFMNEVEHGPLRDPTHTEDISLSYLRFPSYAVSLNIRESSRIVGDYTVTFEDVIHERNFPDVVCRWRSNYDTHLPTSANQSDQAQDWVGILGLWRRPIMGSIPYRSLLPAGVENILVAAMAYSSDHDALIGGRMQPEMEHLGEAAGIAAAMASKLNIPPRKLPIKRLQKELVKQGVLRGKDVPDVKVKNVPSLDELHRQDFWRAERESVFPPSKEGQRLSPEEAVKLLGTDKAPDGMLELYLSGKKAVPFLRPLLYSKNRSIHEEAAVLLGLLGDRMAVPALMEFLQERNTRRFVYKLPLASKRASVPLYWTSIILLGRFEEASAVPELLKILPESPADLPGMQRNHYGSDMFKDISICPPPLVSFIIVALGRIGDKSAVESIKPFLAVSVQPDIDRENRDFEQAWAISTNAAWSLARLGDHSGVPALIDLLSSEQALVRNYAAGLLEKITGQKFGNDRNAWKQWLVNK